MFDALSQSLHKVFKNIRSYGKLTEKNIKDALREVRMALLEADVHYQVAKDFINRVREESIGEEVLESITPGQQVIKRVHEELIALLGENQKDFDTREQPAGILLLGLHGAGKTTTAAKLAYHFKEKGRHVVLAACDIRRPAAVEQLGTLAQQIEIDMVAPQPNETVPNIGLRAWETARQSNADIVIFDTGGRFQIDNELVEEVKELRENVQPRNVVLVLDSAIGQESVHVAKSFHKDIGLTGLILTKLDGDARGGAAISVQSITGCPILLVGTGERLEDLEPFHPDRMASRILGMGDVVSLVEKTQGAFDMKNMAHLEERLRKNTFNLEDFLDQVQQMKKMGSIENLLEMLPTGTHMPPDLKKQMGAQSEKESKKFEAIIQSMTPEERRHPTLINGRRRLRIANGSGTEVRDINELINKLKQPKKMAGAIKKQQKRLLRFGR